LWKELEAAVNALGQAGDPTAHTAVRRWMAVDGFLAARGFQALVTGDPATAMPLLTDVAPLSDQASASHWIQAAAASQDPTALAWLRGLEQGQRPDGWHADWVAGARPFYVSRLLDATPGEPAEVLRLLADPDPFVQAATLDWLREKAPVLDAEQTEAVCRLVVQGLSGDAADPLISAAPLLPRAGETGRDLLTRLLSSRYYPVRLRAALTLKQMGEADPFARIVPMPAAPDDFYRNFLKRGRYGCQVEIRTNKGSFFLELFRNDAPLTCMNFLSLAGERYFDGIMIHRVVPDFVVQAGCPLGTGNGGPGHSIPCEINTLIYDRGMVGMALSGRDTGGSQFFVTLSPQPHLDGGYTIFARVSGGLEVVDNLIEGDRIEGIEIFWDIPWEEKRPLRI
jgi:cyclophilin family peptidyl-prolyl cis-trans isomerase